MQRNLILNCNFQVIFSFALKFDSVFIVISSCYEVLGLNSIFSSLGLNCLWHVLLQNYYFLPYSSPLMSQMAVIMLHSITSLYNSDFPDMSSFLHSDNEHVNKFRKTNLMSLIFFGRYHQFLCSCMFCCPLISAKLKALTLLRLISLNSRLYDCTRPCCTLT